MYHAGFWIRLGAAILDGLIIGLPLAVIAGALTGNFDSNDPFVNLLSSLYSILLPVFWSGRTILFHKTRILYICVLIWIIDHHHVHDNLSAIFFSTLIFSNL